MSQKTIQIGMPFSLFLLATAALALAAPVPKADGKLSETRAKEFDERWQALGRADTAAVEATLWFAKQPEAVVYLNQKLRPLKMDGKEAKQLIAKLFSEKEDEWKEAERELAVRTPLLAMSIKDVWAEAQTEDQRRRLVYVLLGRMTGHEQDDYELKEHAGGRFTLVANKFQGGRQVGSTAVNVQHTVAEGEHDLRWSREKRALYVLEHVGTPDAVKLIEAMATGHPDASPTKTAKDTLARLKKK